MLEAGANSNCISEEDGESLLDWAQFDQFYEETSYKDSDSGERMAQIVTLLKQYGAKPADKLSADKPEVYLKVFASFPTGLLTAKGRIRIERIEGADDTLIRQFTEWQQANPDPWNHPGVTFLPDAAVVEKHYQTGITLAQQIKRLVGNAIRVELLGLDAERASAKQRGIRKKTID